MRSPSPGSTERTAAGHGSGTCAGPASILRARPLLGTLVEVHAAGGLPPPDLNQAVGAAFGAIARVQALMSRQDPASELSRLNRDGARAPQPLHPDTLAVLRAALRFAQLSDGAFDPTLEGGWRDVELTDSAVFFHRPVQLDLGGIAKGYAVDLALAVLEDAGVSDILVNAGGDLRACGQARLVRLRDPREPSVMARELRLQDAALASSSACFSRRTRDGREVSELVDPRSGAYYTGPEGISVLAPDCMSADALTKVVLFAPPAVAQRALAACDASAIRLA